MKHKTCKLLLSFFAVIAMAFSSIAFSACEDFFIGKDNSDANITYTEGLKFTLNESNDAYTVAGIGSATDADIYIPKTYNNLPVTSIDKSAFSYCKDLTSVTIPDSVILIGEYAFNGCRRLTRVTMGDGVTHIGGYAFYDCYGLTSVTIGNSVTEIGSYAFGLCSITDITIASSVTIIDFGAFYLCGGLTKIDYKGTISEWNSITKGLNWDMLTGNYTVYCTDGEIMK